MPNKTITKCDLSTCPNPPHKKSNLCEYHTRERNAKMRGTTVEAMERRAKEKLTFAQTRSSSRYAHKPNDKQKLGVVRFKSESERKMDWKAPWIKDPILEVPHDLIIQAKIRRIQSDGPSANDPPELVAMAGWQGGTRWEVGA